MTVDSIPKVVFIGQLPPPVYGMAITTQLLGEALQATCHLEIVRVSGINTNIRLLFHLSRVVRVLRSISVLIRTAATSKESRIAVIGCDGGLGLGYLLTQVVFARLLGYTIYIHHHSYNYIDTERRLMSAVLAAGGNNLVHVFLAAEMAQAFVNRYSKPAKVLVFSNAAHWPSCEPRDRRTKERPFTLGLLSNLDASKGLFKFVELFQALRSANLEIRAVLAGPIKDRVERALVLAAIDKADGYLEWRGPVYGSAKENFFSDIDLFVFPTCYENEAEPNVLHEAMARGIPVVAYRRGAIGSQVQDGGLVVPREQDFVSSALEYIFSIHSNPNLYRLLSQRAHAIFEENRTTSSRILHSLLQLEPLLVVPERARI